MLDIRRSGVVLGSPHGVAGVARSMHDAESASSQQPGAVAAAPDDVAASRTLAAADVAAVRPDALAPAQIEAKAEAVAVGKVQMTASKCFVSSILAGMFIALGALFFCTFLGDATLPFGIQRVLGGVCFCLGLVLVLCCGAELFTGNALMVTALASKKIALSGMLKNWAIVWVGNLCGSLIVVFIAFMAHAGDMNGGGVASVMISTAVSKINPDWVTLFFKGILCNVLVCLAVWIGYAGRTVVDKVVGILLPITAFVACGFEHCVANMFFLPMGLALNAAGYATTVPTEVLSVPGILYNISAATLGNIVGGAILVGLAYWFLYHKRQG